MEGAAAPLLLHPWAQGWQQPPVPAAGSPEGDPASASTVGRAGTSQQGWPGEPSLSRLSFSGSVCGWLPAAAWGAVSFAFL